MRRTLWRGYGVLAALGAAVGLAAPQAAPPAKQPALQAWTWEQVKERLQLNNPTLLADKLSIDESRAQEITAFLRPNPTLSLTVDGTQIVPHDGVFRPVAGTFESPGISFLQ